MPNLNTQLARRIVYALLLPVVAGLGLAIRAAAQHLPQFFSSYAPDILWAFLVFVLVVVVAPRLSSKQVGAVALGFAFLMECSQLYQASRINDLRATRIGGLLLGFGFLWSDLGCYVAGIGLGVLFDRGIVELLNRRAAIDSIASSPN